MITIFSTLKPITEKTKTIQENAISSWKAVHRDVEVIIFGTGLGVTAFCEDHQVRQIKSIRKTESRLPYVSDIFTSAQKVAKYDILMYANADMIFTRDLIAQIKKVISRHKKYLVIGRRINLDLSDKVNFSNPEEVMHLTALARDYGKLFDHTGIDYFVFNKGLFGDIPDMSIARNRWDNWMSAEGKLRSGALIDATRSITAIHQNHDYSNVNKKKGRNTKKYQQETQRNERLVAGQFASVLDANYRLSKDGLVSIPAWQTKAIKKIDFLYRIMDRKLNKMFGFGLSPKQKEVY